MANTFTCQCGTVCDLEQNQEQTEHYGDGTNTGVTTKCNCCGKVLNFE